MLFFPYRFDLHLNKFPWLTVLIALVCCGVYWQQFANELEVMDRTSSFCGNGLSTIERMALDKATGESGRMACEELMYTLLTAEDSDARIDRIAADSERFAGLDLAASRDYVSQAINSMYARYRQLVPEYQTRELWYAPESWDPRTMVTSTFAHGDWMHLLGNVIFFYAFAAAVEVIIGSGAFLLVVLVLALGTNVAYSLAMMQVDNPLPTVGLSGVVMGMIAMLAYLLPTARIRCFYWMILWFGVIAAPAWLLAVAYIGLDVVTLWKADDLGGVNLVAHVSGAAIGFLLAAVFFRRVRAEIRAEQIIQYRERAVV